VGLTEEKPTKATQELKAVLSQNKQGSQKWFKHLWSPFSKIKGRKL